MRGNHSKKGFTVLEVVVALLLFSLLLGSLWEFFTSMYISYTKFDNKANLLDNGRMVSSFLREEIRQAEQVTITVTDGTLKVINPVATGSTLEAVSGVLDRIEFNTTGPSIKKTDRAIFLKENDLAKGTQGKYELIYQGKDGPESLISDRIENIKVTREENASLVQFECIFSKKDEPLNSQKVKNVFTESLEYKTNYK